MNPNALYLEELVVRRVWDDALRRVLGARDDETTIDAAKRIVAQPHLDADPVVALGDAVARADLLRRADGGVR